MTGADGEEIRVRSDVVESGESRQARHAGVADGNVHTRGLSGSASQNPAYALTSFLSAGGCSWRNSRARCSTLSVNCSAWRLPNLARKAESGTTALAIER